MVERYPALSRIRRAVVFKLYSYFWCLFPPLVWVFVHLEQPLDVYSNPNHIRGLGRLVGETHVLPRDIVDQSISHKANLDSLIECLLIIILCCSIHWSQMHGQRAFGYVPEDVGPSEYQLKQFPQGLPPPSCWGI